MQAWRDQRANQIAVCALATMAGVAAARLGYPPVVLGLVAAALVATCRLGLGMIAIVFLLLGWWRGDTTLLAHTALGQQLGNKVTVAGMVADDAGINERNQASFTLAVTELNGQPISGAVRIYTAGYKELLRGYHVEVTGKLKPARGSVPTQISYAIVQVTSQHRPALEPLRSRFFLGLRGALPEPLSGFGLGLLVGVRALIDKQLQDTLNADGLSHLIAVSGYNLTILILAVRRILQPISTFTATAMSLWLVAGFLLVAGFSASIVRAGLVAVFSLGAGYYGYAVKPSTLICLPALITVIWNPAYLLQDVGWQLSFLAFFGILMVAPLVTVRLKQPNAIKLLVIESLTAQIMTAPLIMYYFSNLSLVSPVANAVILPLVPLAMLLSFSVGVVSFMSSLLAAWIALPGAGLLGLMIGLVQWFATWPRANITMAMSLGQMGIAYVVLGLATVLLRRGLHRSNDRDRMSARSSTI